MFLCQTHVGASELILNDKVKSDFFFFFFFFFLCDGYVRLSFSLKISCILTIYIYISKKPILLKKS
jgi:hypothetical protein